MRIDFFGNMSRAVVLVLMLMLTGPLTSQGSSRLDSIYAKVDWTIDRPELIDRMLDEVVMLRETDDLASASVLLDTIMTIAENSEGVEYQLARCYIDAAIIARMQSMDDLMVSHYQNAIEIYKDLQLVSHDTLQDILTKNISICYNNSAQVFLNKEQYDLALEFYQNAIASVKPMNDSLAMSIGYYNIAQTFGYMSEHDSAYKYIMMSKELEEAMNSDEGLAYAHEGLSRVFNNQEKFVKALMHLDSALMYSQNLGDEFFKLDLVELKSDVLTSISGAKEAIEILEIGIIKSKKIGYKGFEVRASEKLSVLYEELGDYKKAYQHLQILRAFDAETSEEEAQKKIEEFQIQYETEQKDDKIVQLALQNELKEEANQNILEKNAAEDSRNRVINWSLGAGIGLMAFIGLLLFQDSRRRKRINRFLKTNNKNLSEKNEKILHQSKLIGDSINYAQNIQRAILPTRKEMNEHFGDHFVLFQPKDIVSGDFYWMHAIPDTQKVLFAVADCTGHGVPGAFMSIVGHALLEKIAKQLRINKPGQVLGQLAVELQSTLKKGENSVVDDGMDIALVLVDYEQSKLFFSGARNPMLLIKEKEMNHYKGDRIDLGKQVDVSFSETEISFSPGDRFYLFTDGFPDQKGGKDNKKYYPVKFRDLVLNGSTDKMSVQGENMRSEFERWKGNFDQMDDVLVVGIQL